MSGEDGRKIGEVGAKLVARCGQDGNDSATITILSSTGTFGGSLNIFLSFLRIGLIAEKHQTQNSFCNFVVFCFVA